MYLGRTWRTASAAQWIVLHATDRGCTYPDLNRLTTFSFGGAAIGSGSGFSVSCSGMQSAQVVSVSTQLLRRRGDKAKGIVLVVPSQELADSLKHLGEMLP